MHRSLLPQPPKDPGPAWEVATLFPDQGRWSEGDYLDLNRRTNRLVELTDGHVEVLEMPTKSHQRMILFLYHALVAFTTTRHLGEVLVAPYPVRIGPGRFREPDVLFMRAECAERLGEDFAEGADLVIEVVSENRRLDLETKRADYAAAGIPEYWIVDPREQAITVLKLAGETYTEHGVFTSGQKATSALLPGFEIDVEAVWKAARR